MSASDEYGTPDSLFKKLPYNFTLDVAASSEIHKCEKYFTKEDDAFTKRWETLGYIWMNPPYSIKAGGQLKWLTHANNAVLSEDAAGAVCLPMADITTEYWRYSVKNASEVIYLQQRVPFMGADQGARFASMIVIFEPGPRGKLQSMWDWKNKSFNERERL